MGILEGQVAVVTGAGRGFGRAIAERLAAEGANVALLSRSLVQLDEVAEAIRKAGGKAIGVRCDVTDPNSIGHAID
jgi:NAD(P)-dependent dehydrogenase (short-subunit alcohol dehydrogenase family)